MAPDQESRINDLLKQYPLFQQDYIDYLFLCEQLHSYQPFPLVNQSGDRIKDIGRAASTAPDLPLGVSSPPDAERVDSIKREAQRRLEKFLAQEHQQAEQEAGGGLVSFLLSLDVRTFVRRIAGKVDSTLTLAWRGVVMASLLLALGLSIAIGIQYARSHRVVATLGETLKARWEVAPSESGLRPGWMNLQEGFAQLNFKNGTQVILQAPCEVRLKTPKLVFLGNGNVTVKVVEGMGGFTVLTPTAGLVDYGTEFGVRVNDRGETESHVFSGLVSVTAGRQHHLLEKGFAVQVDKKQSIRVSPLQERPEFFARELPDKNEIIHLDLAHIAGGGDGLHGLCPNFALDPNTGKINAKIVTRTSLDPNQYQGDHQFHPVENLPYVDGVFVPDGNYKVVVSSAGHVFADCPPTSNRYWSDIGVVVTRTLTRQQGYALTLNGRDYCIPGSPGINVHSNVGITFDLQAIRASYPDMNIAEFQMICGVSDHSEFTRHALLDMFVLLDGQVIASALGLSMGQFKDIRVPVDRTARYLTLICADAGSSIDSDMGVFGAPMLLLESKYKSDVQTLNTE